MGDRDWTNEARKLGRIEGLEEALEVVESYPPFSDISATIRARIARLEKNPNG